LTYTARLNLRWPDYTARSFSDTTGITTAPSLTEQSIMLIVLDLTPVAEVHVLRVPAVE
jgi:hypothetical protein